MEVYCATVMACHHYLFFFLILGHLAWFVYFVCTFVGGGLTCSSTDEHNAVDGELSCQ